MTCYCLCQHLNISFLSLSCNAIGIRPQRASWVFYREHKTERHWINSKNVQFFPAPWSEGGSVMLWDYNNFAPITENAQWDNQWSSNHYSFFFFLNPASLGMSGDPSQTGTERLSWSFPALASRQSWNEFQDKINLDPKHCVPEDPTGISVLTLYVFSAKITDL